ncbi:unconventional myosin-IXa-like isoform X10 [Bolinopsis microptera]|uniref:unconventional myosin-IXa-like isoform X10 n=1 Tax=Bolinopsis microptera TaxID=2820187 RepID=UPI00307A3E6E
MKCVQPAGVRSPARSDKVPISSRPAHTSPTFLPNNQDPFTPQNLKVYSGSLHKTTPYASIFCIKSTTSAEVVQKALDKFGITDQAAEFQLAEVEENKVQRERRLNAQEHPLELQTKWNSESSHKNFYLRRKVNSVKTTQWVHRTEDLSSIRDVLNSKQRDAPDDLCQLSTLTEQNLLSSLGTRFEKDIIYTYVNSILIAVNPFKDLPIYNVDLVLKYNNKRRDEMPPHIFAVANEALRNMLHKRQNQCMVISGESGSGKTETTRHIIHWLTTTQNKHSTTRTLAQSILGAGELLEAFGNAQTLRNKNSSRFGRFIQLEYRQDGSVHGAVIEKYLLEMSRITNISSKERSYHVFYYLLAGCNKPLYDEIDLKPVSGFNYLNQSVVTVDGMDDHGGFIKLKRSMNMVGISEELQKNIFKVLSAILHIGNITFKQANNIRTSEECVVITDKGALDTVAKLLSVNADLLKEALTTKKSFARGEQFVTHYKRVDATATRDTLAKSLYTYLFDWLLMHVNRGLVADNRRSEHYLSIGLLDMFGFEDFQDGNRFEQFCINYANEQLQHFFDQHIFKLEQDEYTKEKIVWTMVGYKDNESCLELFRGKPIGLLHLLDEENSFPGGSNQSLLQKFNDNHGNHENYNKTQIQENAFEIIHYAGPVQYRIDEFLEKNRGHMRADIVHVLKSSTSLFIKRLIGCDPVALARWTLLRNYIGAVFACRNAIQSYTLSPTDNREQGVSFRPRNKSSDSDGSRSVKDRASAYMSDNPAFADLDAKIRRSSDGPKQNQPPRRSESREILHIPATKHRQTRQQVFRAGARGRRQPRSTVVGQFMSSLTSLVKVLNSANPHFIRCIKSNYDGKPNMFETDFVDRQLRYTGMLETIQIRKASYPVRYNKEEFCNAFRLSMRESHQKDIAKFFDWAKIEKGQYQLGLSKVFMREGPLQQLNEYQDRLILDRVQLIQSHLRGWLGRVKYKRMRLAAILIQRHWREYSKRQRYAAASLIASSWRMFVQRRRYVDMREAALAAQRCWRRNHNLTYPKSLTMSPKTEELFETSPITDTTEPEVGETKMFKDTLMKDIMSTFSFLDDQPDEESVRPSPVPSYTPRPSPEPCCTPSLKDRDSPMQDDLPAQSRTPDSLAPLSPRLDPITTHGRTFLLPEPVLNKLQSLDQEMPEEIDIETDTDYRDDVDHDGSGGSRLAAQSSWNKEGLPPSPLQRGGPARTPYSRSQSVTDPPPAHLVRSSSTNYAGTWSEVQTTSFKFMRSKEEQDTNVSNYNSEEMKTNVNTGRKMAHFSGRRNRKRRSIQKVKKDGSNRLSRSMEDLDCLELSALEEKPKTEAPHRTESTSTTQNSALPTLNHIFKSVPAPRGSVCNSCGKKLQARIFARAMQCQAQTCHKIFHRNCQEKAGQCMPTYEQPKRVLANNLGEILMLEKFILQKIKELQNQGEKVVHDKTISKTFISVLKEFQEYLTRTQASLSANPTSNIFNLYYEECTTIFEHCLTKVKTRSQELKLSIDPKLPVKALFHSMLENFDFCRHEASFKEDARKSLLATYTVRERLTLSRANKAGIIEHNGHRLVLTAYGIVMTCVGCKKRINILEHCKICQECKVNFHQKCYKNSTQQCTGIPVTSPSAQPKPFFGTSIQDLVASEGGVTIPRNLDKMMLVLEQNGLYTLGLYRVNANQNQMKSLKNKLLVNNPDLSIDGIVPATLSAMVKMFFRELPEPILTFNLYHDFMNTSKIELGSRHRALLELVHKLPRVNFLVFERLVYHLAQVANEESTNKMNASSLAVIFAPNLLRPLKEPSAMQALEEVKHRTVVIQSIIESMIKKYVATLAKINSLDAGDTTEDTARRKAECLVQLAQMPNPEDMMGPPGSESVTSDTESSASASISQGIEPLRHVTRTRPSHNDRRAPTRRHSTSPNPSPSNSMKGGGPKSIADGVRKKDGKSRKNRPIYGGGSFNSNHL